MNQEGVVKLYSTVIKGTEYYLPQKIEENDFEDKLTKKIGIYEKHIASDKEYASDLAIRAAEKLFKNVNVDKSDIDFILYCTQSPDYYLPSTSCILQDKLGLPNSIGALDFNLGCSGFVYGLSIAKGFIETGVAKNILFITSDTYSKFINKNDRSVKLLFGDGAAATLLSRSKNNNSGIQSFVFGTDGSGAKHLIVPAGGLRNPLSDEHLIEKKDDFGNIRSNSNLYMNGPEIFNFTLKEVPNAIQSLLDKDNLKIEDFDYFIFHQANEYMLKHLQRKMKIPNEKFSVQVSNCGNTVSSTIPIALNKELVHNNIKVGDRIMLVGFGVGLSWAACSMIWE